MSAQAPALPRSGRRVLAPVCAGHFLSHYYNICLPVLFPLLHAELGVSYAALGLLLTVFNLAGGAAQLPLGFMVDRFGAATLLLAGLLVEGVAVALMGWSAGYAMLLALALIAGLGNAVFHPADYAILGEKIDERRVGRAFSVHTFAGHLGTAAGPVAIGLLLLVTGWREALLVSGVLALLVAGWFLAEWGRIQTVPVAQRNVGAAGARAPPHGWRLLLSTPMLLMFVFFVATSLTSSGVQSFSVTVFGFVHGLPATLAGGLLSAYLFASALGVLAGGVIADRTRRHDLVAIAAFVATALVMLALALVSVPVVLIGVLYTLIGLAQGIIRPARDMLVRAATPPGGLGKAFGFVSSALSLGSAVAPVLFGLMVDSGHPRWVFIAISLFMLAATFAVIDNRRATRASDRHG